jgi:uncharacterized membrane protein
LADPTYLTAQTLSGETMVCGGSADCFKVLGSSFFHIGKLSLAVLGAVAYFSIFSFATLAAFGYANVRRLLLITVWSMFAVTLRSGIYLSRFLSLLFVPPPWSSSSPA